MDSEFFISYFIILFYAKSTMNGKSDIGQFL